MSIIIGNNRALTATVLKDHIFWKIDASGSLEPFTLATSVIHGLEEESQNENPDLPVIGNRHFQGESVPAPRLIPYIGSDIPLPDSPEFRALLKLTRSNFPTDYPSIQAAAAEVFGLYSAIDSEIYLTTKKKPEFYARSKNAKYRDDGKAVFSTRGSKRAGQSIANDNGYRFSIEIYIGTSLDVPFAYVGRYVKNGGNSIANDDLNFGNGILDFSSIVNGASNKAAIETALSPSGSMNSNGFTVNADSMFDRLEELGIIPAGTARALSIVSIAMDRTDNKLSIWTIRENI
jgi:hypothetical protein